jgi:hypothetical protein
MSFSSALARLNTAVLRTFAEVTVVRAGYPSFPAVFDQRTDTDDLLGEMPGGMSGMFSGPVPVLTVATGEVATVAYGEQLTVDGVVYTVRDIRPDGEGLTLIRLKRA